MKLDKTEIHIIQDTVKLSSKAKTGISMHCHTEHSKEMLDFVPHYAGRLPIISYFWKKERDKYEGNEGKKIDFATAYWSPPLTAQAVYKSEINQINNAGLEAIASITDHDSIDGALKVNEAEESFRAPISFEWTVPFDFGFFHVGVHNLPREQAVELTKTLLDYTFVKENHTNEKLQEVFSMLNELPGVLVILNHPLWDIELVGKQAHELLLNDFLKTHGKWIHALEINGFRSWSENKAVIEIAEAIGLPIATGGDRHGCKPNTVLNLSNATTFDEFVEEIRVDKRSEVVMMPEYEQPLHSRQMQSFSEILALYPEFPEERRRWFDRVFFNSHDGKGLVPLSAHGWKLGGPKWLRMAIWTLGFLGGAKVRPIFRVVRKKADRPPKDIADAKFVKADLDELSPTLSSGMV